MQGRWIQSLSWEDPLEKGMATHSSILAWKSPWTEKPGRLQSIESQRVGHDWRDLACVCTFIKAARFDGRVREAEWILIIQAFLSLHASRGHRGKCLKPIGLELAENPWKGFEIFLKFTPSQGYRIFNSTVLLKFLWIEHILWVRLRGPHLDERAFLWLFFWVIPLFVW